MAELTENEFSKHVHSKFNLADNERNLQLELVEVRAYRRTGLVGFAAKVIACWLPWACSCKTPRSGEMFIERRIVLIFTQGAKCSAFRSLRPI